MVSPAIAIGVSGRARSRLGGAGVNRPVWAYVLVGGLIVVAQHLVPQGGHDALTLGLKVGLYVLVSASAAVAVAVGVHRYRPDTPGPWVLIGVSQFVYATADLVFYLRRDVFGLTNYPSISDVLYLAHYAPLIAGLLWLIRVRTPGRDVAAVLDGGILACGFAMLSWTYLIDPIYDGRGFDWKVTSVSMAFPAVDVVVLALGLRLLIGVGRRTSSFYSLVGALGLLLSTDALYGLQQLNGSYSTGNYLDVMWLGYYLLLGTAALHPSMKTLTERAPVADAGIGPLRLGALAIAALTSPVILLVQSATHASYDVDVLAAGAGAIFLLVLARMSGLVAAQRRAAITDGLTGLHNRRFFEEQLSLEAARSLRTGEPLGLLMLDIDNFKRLNDAYGHPTGDRVLSMLAERLRTVTRDGDIVARVGGEEFAVLAPRLTYLDQRRIAERIRTAITGEPFAVSQGMWSTVTVSIGAASIPQHTRDAQELVILADRALYAAKHAGRDRILFGRIDMPPLVDTQDNDAAIIDHLCRLADQLEGYQAPHEHSTAIGRWAGVFAEHARLASDEQMLCSLAGRLHDIGKISVPRSILSKPGRLTDQEWELIRTHPERGAVLLSTMPRMSVVAEIIAQHHERFDGGGYPRGLARSDIHVSARIIALCDSYAAMRVDRPYQKALDVERAREEIMRGRGTQFDPDLANLFLELLDSEVLGELGQLLGTGEPEPASTEALKR